MNQESQIKKTFRKEIEPYDHTDIMTKISCMTLSLNHYKAYIADSYKAKNMKSGIPIYIFSIKKMKFTGKKI